jgi:hypothetical protein
MLTRIVDTSQTMTNVTGDTYGAAISMDNISTLSVQSVIDVNTPSAETFAQDNVNVTDNTFPTLLTVFPSGLKVRATSTGTLPAHNQTGYFFSQRTRRYGHRYHRYWHCRRYRDVDTDFNCWRDDILPKNKCD